MSARHGELGPGGNLNPWGRDVLSGIGSLLDISGSYVRLHCQYRESDAHAIGRDWKAVGQDLTHAMTDFGRKADGKSQ